MLDTSALEFMNSTTQEDMDAMTLLGRLTAHHGGVSRNDLPYSKDLLNKPLHRVQMLGLVDIDGEFLFLTPKGTELINKVLSKAYSKKKGTLNGD